ncbi:hypothetical protein [uncultured Cohaesibacter sp.]|uniref:hypothetical protein n=1 Tax=uncultured Cohaesibacter sp. TaxID=1002546 RepID=UPI0029C95C7D|nr:hypothetical protein [uncultured Cohaesibacter sp.]
MTDRANMAKSDGEMSIERFEELLDSYGPDLTNWPQDAQSAANGLLKRSAIARQKLQFDAAVARLAKEAPGPKAPSSLVNRIMTKVKK